MIQSILRRHHNIEGLSKGLVVLKFKFKIVKLNNIKRIPFVEFSVCYEHQNIIFSDKQRKETKPQI